MGIFKRYFGFKVRTRTLFNFLKYCYSRKKMPKNHNKALKKCLRNYANLKNVNHIHNVYNTYNKDSKMHYEEQDAPENHNRSVRASKTYGSNQDEEQEQLKFQLESEYDHENVIRNDKDNYEFSDLAPSSVDEKKL